MLQQRGASSRPPAFGVRLERRARPGLDDAGRRSAGSRGLDADNGEQVWCTSPEQAAWPGTARSPRRSSTARMSRSSGPAPGQKEWIVRLHGEPRRQVWSRTWTRNGETSRRHGRGHPAGGRARAVPLFDWEVGWLICSVSTRSALRVGQDGSTLWTRRKRVGLARRRDGPESGTAMVQEWSCRMARPSRADQPKGDQEWSRCGAGASFDAGAGVPNPGRSGKGGRRTRSRTATCSGGAACPRATVPALRLRARRHAAARRRPRADRRDAALPCSTCAPGR